MKNEPRVYVVGGDAIVAQAHKAYSREIINQKYDSYLPVYKKGRRVPLAYFNTLIKYAGITLTDEQLHSLQMFEIYYKNLVPTSVCSVTPHQKTS